MNQIVNKNLRIPETLRKVKNIVGVFSAKGGVGKSAIALQLAISLKEKGYKVVASYVSRDDDAQKFMKKTGNNLEKNCLSLKKIERIFV